MQGFSWNPLVFTRLHIASWSISFLRHRRQVAVHFLTILFVLLLSIFVPRNALRSLFWLSMDINHYVGSQEEKPDSHKLVEVSGDRHVIGVIPEQLYQRAAIQFHPASRAVGSDTLPNTPIMSPQQRHHPPSYFSRFVPPVEQLPPSSRLTALPMLRTRCGRWLLNNILLFSCHLRTRRAIDKDVILPNPIIICTHHSIAMCLGL